MMSGGKQANVIPPEFGVTLDVRLAIDVDHQAFDDMIRKWCEAAGDEVTHEFLHKQLKVPPTIVDDSNEYWMAFKRATDEL